MTDNPDKNSPTPAPTLSAALRSSRWAASLDADELARVDKGMCERQVVAGGFVCRKGEPVDCWYGIIEGLAKMSSDWVTGKTATYTGIPAGGWFGEGSILKSEPRRYDVIALRDSRIACMRRETFQWLLDHSIPFNRFLLTQLNERLGQFIGLLESERLLDTDTRVARCLAGLFNPILYPGLGPQISISQEEIGYLAGVSRQRVNRSLKILEDAGFLSIEYGGVTILDLDGLRRFGG
ncbi:MAG: Crp/Fnr family transcriptional regulator [Rhodocyclaceae bacterium]|nr:Crp/Fnr family transcriptional regulator [Rhodocyclaceae bacterium]